MRFIKYMKIVPVGEGYYFLINGLNGSIETVDEEGYQLCRAWQKAGEIKPSSPSEEQAYQFLQSRGYLCQEREDEAIKERYFTELKNYRDNSKTLYLQLVVTYDCNFRCRYCYEKTLLSKGKEWLSKSMDVQMVRRIYEFVDREGYQLKNPKIYGGEPLLLENQDVIAEIFHQNALRHQGTHFPTNGYHLLEYIPLLKQYPASTVHVTLDGSKAAHDHNRYTSEKHSTYDRIVEGIIQAVEAGLKVTVRSNVYVGEEQGIIEMLEYFTRKGLMDKENLQFYTNPVFGEGPGECATLSEYLAPEYRKLLESIEKYPRVINSLPRIHSLATMFLGKSSWSPRYNYCSAGINYVMIDAHGTVYPCQSLVQREDQAIGHFDGEKILFNERRELWMNRSIDRMESCQDCWALFICGGGCGKRAVEELGDLQRSVCSQTICLENELLPYMFERYIKNTL